MAKGNNETLTAEQEMQLRQPIEDYVGEIQKKIDSLRTDGTNRVVAPVSYTHLTLPTNSRV